MKRLGWCWIVEEQCWAGRWRLVPALTSSSRAEHVQNELGKTAWWSDDGMVRDELHDPPFSEVNMGSKPSHAQPSNRPESGGADRDELREKSGLLDRDKEQLARSEAAKKTGNTEAAARRGEDSGENH